MTVRRLRLDGIAPEARPVAALAAVADGKADFQAVRAAADGCRACDLWARATQTVCSAMARCPLG